MMLQRLTPLMKAHLAMAAKGAWSAPPAAGPPSGAARQAGPQRLPPLPLPAARLVAWPRDEGPGELVLPAWRRHELRARRPGRVPVSMASAGAAPARARLVAWPEGARVFADPPKDTLALQIRAACAAVGCSRPELLGPSRDRRLTIVRAELFWLGRAFYGLSLPQIGRAMGDRDHTTVLNSLRRAQAAFRAAGLDTEAALALTAEARRAIIAAHFKAMAGRAHEDQRSVPA
jgi:hypothetical protein